MADLRSTGEVTEANIFANTRLLTQKCVGCSLEKPESQREIAACYASAIVEEKLLKEYVQNPAFSGGQTSSIQLKGLNNGSEEYDLETMAKLVTEQHDKLVKGKDKGPERNQSRGR